ncbi:hypothetical protein N9L68_05295 [bacterium]|nr:hypothetical protein [bacterium]
MGLIGLPALDPAVTWGAPRGFAGPSTCLVQFRYSNDTVFCMQQKWLFVVTSLDGNKCSNTFRA